LPELPGYSGCMSSSPELTWQPSLLATAGSMHVDRSFSGLRRVDLDDQSWVDHVPEWVSGADLLFEQILTGRRWQQRSRHMYDRRLLEPRLTAPWSLESGEPLEPPILRSEEHTSELQSRGHLVCRLLLEKKKNNNHTKV